MKVVTKFIYSHAKQALVIILIAAAYSSARLPVLSGAERARLASHFAFTRIALPEVYGYSRKSIRKVNPLLNRFSAWISAVGASVALSDLDGDGLPNDVCYVDTGIDRVVVATVPGTPARYGAFVLYPPPSYDSSAVAPMGCLPGDFNEDGLTDILVYYWGRTPTLHLRMAQAAADERAGLSASLYEICELAPGTERWYTNAATQADVDGDGHVDLILGNYFPDGSRILDANADDAAQMQHSMSRAFNGGRNRFLLWKGAASGAVPTAKFEEVNPALADDLVCGWTLAVGAADLDGDLLPEVYFANDFGPDRLLHNLSKPGELRFEPLMGERTLTTPNSKVIGRDSFKGMGVDFGDLNADGFLDFFVSNIADEYALEESHFLWISTGRLDRMGQGVAPYVDRGEELGLSRSGWGWDTRLGDFDNDGTLEALQATGFLKGNVNRWPELHELAMGNDQLLENPQSWPRFRPGDDLSGASHVPFFVRAGDGRYYDLARELGLGHNQVSRGIATGDVDGDGRLDYAIANQWDSSYFYSNQSPDPGAFLGLHLLLPFGKEKPQTEVFDARHPRARLVGRPAIGASATVYLPDGRRLVAQVESGNGHSGKRSPDLHFGLGPISADAEIKVDLRWRDAEGQVSQKTIVVSPGWQTVLLGR
jgi:enediyne biosynthesis protein E4